jgi:DNA-binding beta-propeller fold protein YncE
MLIAVAATPRAALAGEVPTFAVDASWPKPLPNNWILGQVGGITVDSKDHIWVIHRPRSLTDDEKGATLNPPRSKCCASAPPVLEFDSDGNLLRSWGGPGEGYEWVGREHGIEVDEKGFVWVGGNADNDNAILKFTLDGKFLGQIGKIAPTKGSNDTTQLGKPAETAIDKDANEIYIADGYGNRRVIVFDADTGVFKRMWGAFGNEPIDAVPAGRGAARGGGANGGGRGAAPVLDVEGQGSPQFGGPVHAVKVSNDALVYVADRPNRRVQVFTPEGKFVTQTFINRSGPSPQSAAGLAFSPDAQQQFLYVADYGNSHIAVLDRKSLQVLYQFGQRSDKPGDFQGLHHLAIDSKGNLYTGEVAPGARAQRFVFKGLSDTLPANALTPEQLGPAAAQPAAPAPAAQPAAGAR